MQFIKKSIQRIGKTAENFRVTFLPLELKVNVYDPSTEFVLVFKRGPQKDPTRRYKATNMTKGVSMQTVEFGQEEFSRVSGFYLEAPGRYQEKIAKI